MHAYVGATDGDWYRHLAALGADEVNFWRPKGRARFQRIKVGEPFLFKSHAADGNRLVGGGFYSGFAALRLSDAWGFYGEANGASTLDQMRERVGRYRQTGLASGDDPEIGCVFVRDVKFFGAQTLPPPPDWALNIVQGKGFDMDASAVRPYFDLVMAHLLGAWVEFGGTWHRPGPMFGDPRLTSRRLGQRAFQGVVLGAYRGRCAITGDRIRPVLQAAPIRPVSEGGEHRVDNGLLLRSDVHTLFDRGYLGVDPSYRLVVSPRLRAEFGNGDEFYVREASKEPITVPDPRLDKPNREFLEWHLDERILTT